MRRLAATMRENTSSKSSSRGLMAPSKLRGVIAAVATPVNEDGSPDTARATELARHLIDNGCDGLNVLGTTGEATSFSLDERKRVMGAYKAAGLPLDRMMVGTGAAATRRRGRADALRRRAWLCRRAGAAAVLLQGRAGRRPGRLYRRHRAGDGEQARADLSLSLPAAIRPALACRAGEAAARHASAAASSG